MAKLVADLLTKAGADHIVTMDLHAGQIQVNLNYPELINMRIIGF